MSTESPPSLPIAQSKGDGSPKGDGAEIQSPVRSASRKSIKVFSFIDQSKPAADLAWENLGFSVAAKKGLRKEILKGLTGELRPGELTCILGPSGAGKTSLLNLLAGRVRKGGKNKAEITGEVRVNGQPIEPSSWQQLFGYVMQDDALLGTMTPREILQFSAKLRLKTTSAKERRELVEDLLESLGLRKCQDTMVGDALIKGISGGERKRTAVGAELITNPAITFLDEPTSGLDTGSAYNVISILHELTMLKRSVLCTIHQPSSEIFHLFDQAIFLAAGQVVFHGSPSEIRGHFNKLDEICPQDYNPADFVMFMIATGQDDLVNHLIEGWKDSGLQRDLLECTASQLPEIPKKKAFCVQLFELSHREVLRTLRDRGTLGARFGSTIFLNLIYALVFFRVGSTDVTENIFVDRDTYDLQSHAGALTMVAIGAMFGAAQPLLLTFATERPVFMREYSSNMYGAIPYFLSKTAVEVPLIFLQCLCIWVVVFWMMALQGNFFIHWFASVLIALAAASTALLVGCLVSDAKQAMEAAPALFVPQILFAGFFIKISLIPSFMRWLQYICSLKWGMNILLLNEFEDVPGGDEKLLAANDINASHGWIYVGVLLAIFVVFRCLAVFALSRKAKAFYN